MRQPAAVLLLDDGELDDVQKILEDLGVSYGRVRGQAIPARTPPPRDLLVATPRRVDAVPQFDTSDPSAADPVRVVVVNEDSNALRAQLRDVGFDYLVRRPVHAEALRLLLLHCLYKGEERRRERRIPVGLDVSFRTGLLPRRATLVDLSSGGCRLLSPYALEPGMRIRVQIPGEVTSGEGLSLRGRVLRIHLDEHREGDGLYSTAVVFESLPPDRRQALTRLIRSGAHARIAEAPDLLPEPAEAEPAGCEPVADTRAGRAAAGSVHADRNRAAPPQEVAGPAGDGGDRRKTRRSSYARKVPAFGDPALRVLVGRDLSSAGMRIERFPELTLGDRLHLAIYGDASAEPVLVWGTVARNDAEQGLALSFDPVHPSVGHRLDRLVASLPAVESLQDDEAAAMGTVVSQVLDD